MDYFDHEKLDVRSRRLKVADYLRALSKKGGTSPLPLLLCLLLFLGIGGVVLVHALSQHQASEHQADEDNNENDE